MPHMLKDVAVFFDDTEDGRNLLSIAARLAGEQNSHLIGITAAQCSDALLEDGFARGDAIANVIRKHHQASSSHLSHASDMLEEAAKRYDVFSEFRVMAQTGPESQTALHSLSFDLLIAGHPSAPGIALVDSTIKLLQETGVPLLIVPRAWGGKVVGEKITVAWNSTRQARRAIADALPLLILAQSVNLLIVDADRRPELHGGEPGADMAAHLARHGVSVTLECAPSNGRSVADTILAHAIDNSSDLIVLGVSSRARFVEVVLGGVTRTLLAEVTIPLFISH